MHLRRTNIHLIADMLCLGEVGVTEIMFGANMSYRQVRQYLDFLVAGRFLESTGKARFSAQTHLGALLSHYADAIENCHNPILQPA